MELNDRLLRRNIVDHAELDADAGLIAEIAADMQAHAGAYLPGATWLTLETWDTGGAEDVSASAFTRTAISDKFGSSEQLLPEWIGVQSSWQSPPAFAEPKLSFNKAEATSPTTDFVPSSRPTGPTLRAATP